MACALHHPERRSRHRSTPQPLALLLSVLALILILCGLPLHSDAQRSAPQRQVPRTLPPLFSERPSRPITQVLVKLRPGVEPRQFARRFSADHAATQAPDGVGAGTLAASAAAPTLVYRRSNADIGWHVFRLPSANALASTLDALYHDKDVLRAEPDYAVNLLISNPNDFFWKKVDDQHLIVILSGFGVGEARTLDSSTWTYTWNLETVNALGGWNVYPGHYSTAFERMMQSIMDPSRVPLVGVIDTGVDMTHPDFTYTGNPSKGTVDSDIAHGGQIAYSLARNVVAGNVDPNPLLAMDDFGHGTSVSGIIGAAPNNGSGIPGIGFPSQIVPIKVIDAQGNGDDSDLLDAITYAADSHCVAVNMSLSLDTTSYPQALQDAVDYAWNSGTLLVAAAGNDGSATNPLQGQTRRYPASLVHVLAVGATSYNGPDVIGGGGLASYSNSGLSLGVVAPGGDVSTFNNNSPDGAMLGLDPIQEYVLVWSLAPTYEVVLSDPGSGPDGTYASLGLYGDYNSFAASGTIINGPYGYLPGTSLACPHVTGLAALYAARNRLAQAPGVPQKLMNAIERGAARMNLRVDGGYDTTFGHGQIDAGATLSDSNSRQATVGGCVGQLTVGTTPVGNVQIVAQQTPKSKKYFAVTFPDGIFHFINMPAGTYTVTATAFGITGTNSVTILPGCDQHGINLPLSGSSQVQVTVAPKNISIPYGGQQQFTATVTGSGNTAVIWSLPVDAGATIDPNGLLHAPVNPGSSNQALVKATSVADPTKFDTSIVTFTVPPPALSSLTIAPSTVTGGSPATGTVTLSSAAPAGGVSVSISSDNAAASPDSSVTIAANSTSGTFNIKTSVVAANTVANITATYNGVNKTAALTVQPASFVPVNLTPIADVVVSSGPLASSNFGFTTTLAVSRSNNGTNRVTYLKFDLTNVTVAPNSATLQLTEDSSRTGPANAVMTVSAYGLANNGWAENGITWNNAPGLDRVNILCTGSLISSTPVTLQFGALVNIDLTSYIKANIGSVVTIQLANVTPDSNLLVLNSKEAASGRPILKLK